MMPYSHARTNSAAAGNRREGHVLVCIDSQPDSLQLLHTAKCLAEEKNLPWTVVHIERKGWRAPDPEDLEAVMRYLTHAEEMGAELLQMPHSDVEEGIVAAVRQTGAGHLVIGRTRLGWHIPLYERLMQRLPDVAILPVTLHHEEGGMRLRECCARRTPRLRDIAAGMLASGIAFGITELLFFTAPYGMFDVNAHKVLILYLLACILAAGIVGFAAGLISGLLSAAIVTYYYIPPLERFAMHDPADSLAIAIFCIAAAVASAFSGYSRAYAQLARDRERRAQALYRASRVVGSMTSRDEVVKVLEAALSRILGMQVAYFLPCGAGSRLECVYPADIELDEICRRVLEECWSSGQATGAGTPQTPDALWRFEIMITSRGRLGVLGIAMGDTEAEHLPDASFGRFVEALADQSAVALERIELFRQMEETRVSEEREKLRAMLLSSVSHDLKTPLASIIGSLSAVRHMGDALTRDGQATLIETALEEAERLNQFITNILDMTKLETGSVTIRREWAEMEALIQRVMRRLRHRLSSHRITLEVDGPPCEAHVDIGLIEQVIQNLLDNAIKYSASGTVVMIRCQAEESAEGLRQIIQIIDEGPGIAEGDRERIFNKYARLQRRDSQTAGTGLGLAICRSIMELHGGHITVDSRDSLLHDGLSGAVFTLTLPDVRPMVETPLPQEIQAAAQESVDGNSRNLSTSSER